MNLVCIGEWLYLRAPESAAQVCARLSRLLLILVAVELITMPLTQHLWTWDGFLHGGQDFELGLFMIVTCLCLVLLRAQHCCQRVRLFLAIGQLFRLIFCGRTLAGMIELCRVSEDRRDPHFRRSFAGFTVPLQI